MKLSTTNIITCLFFLLNSVSFTTFSQDAKFPQNYFRAPVDFTMTLSGNFAELRNNHFHSGIDIRTFTTGKKVYSIADGFVSRIKIAAGGYGKAIYIDHPNGYTSVYAHLDHFNPEIEKFVKAHQYKKNSFEFDLELKKDQIQIKKGNIIAYSGNTGSSAGPHLHFEIRDTKSEHPLNPLLFGFRIKDTTPPKIFSLYIYPLDSISSVNGHNTRQQFSVTYYNNAYHLKGDPKVRLLGQIGFALETNDYMDNTWGKCGIFELKMNINDSLQSNYKFKEFSFDKSRFINSHMDYALNITKKKRIHKTFKDPNNQLSIYSKMNNNGVYSFKSEKSYKIDFIISDAKNNISKLRVYAKGATSIKAFPQEKFTKLLNWETENIYENSGIQIKFPKNSFYTDLKFNYSVKKDSNFYSDIHSIQNENVPVHTYYTLSIKPRTIPNHKSEKLLIVRVNKDKSLSYEGGIYFDGSMKTKTRYFGDFTIAIDTVPPTIKARTNFALNSLKGQKSIRFSIDDELSGIKSYKGLIDEKWVLFEYDEKNKLLFYTFDKKRLISGRKHKLQLIVTDKIGNKSNFKEEFIW